MSAPAPQRTGFLQGARVIFGRELAAMFDSSIAYVTTIGFLLLATSLYMNELAYAMRAAQTKAERAAYDASVLDGMPTRFEGMSLNPTTDALKRKSVLPTKG